MKPVSIKKLFRHGHRLAASSLSEQGNALISVLMAVAIGGIVVAGLATMITRSNQGVKSASLRTDLEAMKLTILNSLHCRATLGVTMTSPRPAVCPGNIVLKRSDGSPMTNAAGQLGVWTLRARCVNKHLEVGATKAGNDPLTGEPWASVRNGGVLIANDLFGGVSDFCRQELDASFTSCTDPSYPIYMGKSTAGPNCCRRSATARSNVGAAATCSANEFPIGGYGGCQNNANNRLGFVHTMGLYGTNAFVADCFDPYNGHGTPTDIEGYAVAICCPR